MFLFHGKLKAYLVLLWKRLLFIRVEGMLWHWQLKEKFIPGVKERMDSLDTTTDCKSLKIICIQSHSTLFCVFFESNSQQFDGLSDFYALANAARRHKIPLRINWWHLYCTQRVDSITGLFLQAHGLINVAYSWKTNFIMLLKQSWVSFFLCLKKILKSNA